MTPRKKRRRSGRRSAVAIATPAPTTGSILHLSDLHFSPRPEVDAKNPPLFALDSWSVTENEGLVKYAKSLTDVRFLVISGDLVDYGAVARAAKRAAKGKPAQQRPAAIRRERGQALARAAEFIKKLAEAVGLSGRLSTHVIVCPGNHDVDRTRADTKKPGALSLGQFRQHMACFLTPFSTKPWTADPDSHVCILALSTTSRGGAKFQANDKIIQVDAPSLETDELDATLARLLSEAGHAGSLQRQLIGVCVTHHPLAMTPYPGVEVKFYSDPIGATAGRSRLLGAGFQIFLHGHRHSASAQREEVFHVSGAEAGGWIIGAPSLKKAEGGFKGFNVVRFGISCTGEANLRVLPHVAAHPMPTSIREKWRGWLLRVPSRCVAEADHVKFLERIYPGGNARSDISFFGIPLPASADELLGWQKMEGGDRLRFRILRVAQSDQSRCGEPKLQALQPRTHASWERSETEGKHFLRLWTICLDAEAGAESAGVLERSFSPCAYATSARHQRWVSARLGLRPDGKIGQEAVIFSMRTPAKTLEFFLRWPDEQEQPVDAAVHAYVERQPSDDPSPELDHGRDLLDLSDWSIDSMWPLKRCRAVIKSPLTGVSYALVWSLPDRDPGISATLSDSAFRDAIREAEQLRKRLVQQKDTNNGMTQFYDWLVEHLTLLGLSTKEDLEVVVFCPKQELAVTDATGEVVPPQEIPVLIPVWIRASTTVGAHQLSEDQWEAGRGLAGRAFSTNYVQEYVSPAAHFYQARRDRWSVPDVDVYEQIAERPGHSVLYGIPMRHPRAHDIILGVLCIGSYREDSRLNLALPPQVSREEYTGDAYIPRTLRELVTDRFHRTIEELMSTR